MNHTEYVTKTEKRKRKKTTWEDTLKMVNNMGLGYSLVIPILLGVFFGLALDRWLHTKPIFMLIGIVGGVIASFYTILTSDK